MSLHIRSVAWCTESKEELLWFSDSRSAVTSLPLHAKLQNDYASGSYAPPLFWKNIFITLVVFTKRSTVSKRLGYSLQAVCDRKQLSQQAEQGKHVSVSTRFSCLSTHFLPFSPAYLFSALQGLDRKSTFS